MHIYDILLSHINTHTSTKQTPTHQINNQSSSRAPTNKRTHLLLTFFANSFHKTATMPPKGTKRRASTGNTITVDPRESSTDAIAKARAVAAIASKKQKVVEETPPMSEAEEDEDEEMEEVVVPSRGRSFSRGSAGGLAAVKLQQQVALETRTQAAVAALARRSPSPVVKSRATTPVSAPRTQRQTPASVRSPAVRGSLSPKIVVVNAGEAMRRKSLSPVRPYAPPFSGVSGGVGTFSAASDRVVDRRKTINVVPEQAHKRSISSERAVQRAKQYVAESEKDDIPVEIYIPAERRGVRFQGREAEEEASEDEEAEGRAVLDIPDWAEHGDAIAVVLVLMVAVLALYFGRGDALPNNAIEMDSNIGKKEMSFTPYVLGVCVVLIISILSNGGYKHVSDFFSTKGDNEETGAQATTQPRGIVTRRAPAPLPFTATLGISPPRSRSPMQRPIVDVQSSRYVTGTNRSPVPTTPTRANAVPSANALKSSFRVNAQIAFFIFVLSLLIAASVIYPDRGCWYLLLGAAALLGGYIWWWRYEAGKIHEVRVNHLERYVRNFLSFYCESKPYPHDYILADLKDRCYDKQWLPGTSEVVCELTPHELRDLWGDALYAVMQHGRIRTSRAEYHGQEMEHLQYVGDTPLKKNRLYSLQKP